MKLHKTCTLVVLALTVASIVAGCAPFRQVLGQDQAGADSGRLAGTSWRLIALGEEAVSGEPHATLTFTEDEVNGVAFCNSYFGGYTMQADEMEIGPLVQTEKYCMDPEGVMELERDFLQALSVANSYAIEDGRLALFDADGTVLLSLTAQDN